MLCYTAGQSNFSDTLSEKRVFDTMAKISKISGFPEWLPEQKLVEDTVVQTVKSVYELHGFVPIETPSVELRTTLNSQGIADKEIYVLQRARAEEGEVSDLGLHFDLTVPFARYVAQHFNDLVFPFKRYQLQRSWRGERPQKGRFREFYQFDIDIVGRDSLPLSCDAEVVLVVDKVFRKLALGKYVIKLNNRKVLFGLYESLGLSPDQQKQAIVSVDKLDKIGRAGVLSELTGTVGLKSDVGEKILAVCDVRCAAMDLSTVATELKVESPLFQEGVNELRQVLELVPEQHRTDLEIDFSLARGLGYYSGLILETRLVDFPDFGSVCGGGRYEGLVSQFLNKNVPGVGVSVGITRLMDLIFRNNLLPATRKSPARVLVSVFSEEQRLQCVQVAEELRLEGVAVEVFFKSLKLGKQIDFAAKKSIPYVLFIDPESSKISIKDVNSGEQNEVSDLKAWANSEQALNCSG